MICEGHLHVTASGGGGGGVLIVWGCGRRQKEAENAGQGQEVKPRLTNTRSTKHIKVYVSFCVSPGLRSASPLLWERGGLFLSPLSQIWLISRFPLLTCFLSCICSPIKQINKITKPKKKNLKYQCPMTYFRLCKVFYRVQIMCSTCQAP